MYPYLSSMELEWFLSSEMYTSNLLPTNSPCTPKARSQHRPSISIHISSSCKPLPAKTRTCKENGILTSFGCVYRALISPLALLTSQSLGSANTSFVPGVDSNPARIPSSNNAQVLTTQRETRGYSRAPSSPRPSIPSTCFQDQRVHRRKERVSGSLDAHVLLPQQRGDLIFRLRHGNVLGASRRCRGLKRV